MHSGPRHVFNPKMIRRPTQPTVAEAYRELSSTFVSKHVELPSADVTSFLHQRGLQFRLAGAEVVVKECPFCHDIGKKVDNMWKLYIGLKNG